MSESIAIHGKPFSEGEFLKQACLASEPKLLYLQNTDTILPGVKERTRSWNTMEQKKLKLNNTQGKQKQIYFSVCPDESTNIIGPYHKLLQPS
jgi:hypothetical protein